MFGRSLSSQVDVDRGRGGEGWVCVCGVGEEDKKSHGRLLMTVQKKAAVHQWDGEELT